MPESQEERRVVIVGAGFAGFNAAAFNPADRISGQTIIRVRP